MQNETMIQPKNVTEIAEKARQGVETINHTLSEKSTEISRDLTTKLNQTKNQAGKALETTSATMQRAADYVYHHEIPNVGDYIIGMIRKHPGKSVAIAAIIGLMLGKGMIHHDKADLSC